MAQIEFLLNDRKFVFTGDPNTPLLWVLRNQAKLTGTKFGCGVGACGACTIHIDGAAARSCITPVESAARTKVTTIEGLSDETIHPVQLAWIAEDVPQCGYCQTGMIMAVAALLRDIPQPDDTQIADAITNICRCGTYPRIRRAIKRVSER